MRRKRFTRITGFIQQYRLPKPIHFFKMFGPSVLNHRIKYGSNKLVFLNPLVECIYESFNIIKCFNVFHNLKVTSLFQGSQIQFLNMPNKQICTFECSVHIRFKPVLVLKKINSTLSQIFTCCSFVQTNQIEVESSFNSDHYSIFST